MSEKLKYLGELFKYQGQDYCNMLNMELSLKGAQK